jgi:hypothetical protein
VLLVQPLGLAHWTDVQTGVIVTGINTFSALLLAAVAHFWSKSTSEYAVLSGAASAFLLSLFAAGNAFHWWILSQNLQDQLLAFFGAIFLLGVAAVVRTNVTSKQTLGVETAKAAGPEANAR